MSKTQRIDVYDAKNRDRLLGSVERPFIEHLGPRLRMAAAERPRVWNVTSDPPLHEFQFHSVEFERQTRYTNNGWAAEVVLTTDAELRLLMKLETFRLPGETPAQARQRWYA